jgi:hypothetical protein
MSGNTDLIWGKDVSQKPSFPRKRESMHPWIPGQAEDDGASASNDRLTTCPA